MHTESVNPVIWCLLDSRPGHRNQVLGLMDAVQRRIPADVHQIPVNGVTHGLTIGMARRCVLPVQTPQAIVGAGHSTHLPLLQLGQRFRARTIVLMKPTLPLRLFDACLIPDVYEFRRHPKSLILTTGVLNRIQPSAEKAPDSNLLLIGGPSSHHEWSDRGVLEQLQQVIKADMRRHWEIVTSRRTPASFLAACRDTIPDIKIVTPESVSPDWLPKNLGNTSQVWVTEDSVSMMFEAVTSGAATGIIELPRTRQNRATKCIDMLIQQGQATNFSQWLNSKTPVIPPRPLREADRCAEELIRTGIIGNQQKTAASRDTLLRVHDAA